MEQALDKEKAEKVRAAIAEVVGFEVSAIQDTDRFITDYNIAYAERKALLERLNAEFGKELGFAEFCALDDVAAVLRTYAG